MKKTARTLISAAAVATMALSACGGSDSPAPSGSASGSSGAPANKTVTILTHDSWNMDKKVIADFTKKTGYQPKFVSQGDAGALVNQLVLTKDSPLGDVVYGIDNTFAARAVDEKVLDDYTSPDLPKGVEAMDGQLNPVDKGDVCINADKTWFAKKKVTVPVTLDDLTKPDYKNLLVVSSPATSSPGMAFLAATVGAKGEDGWQDYWRQLKANGVKVDKGWTDAYNVDFSAGEGKGKYPLVLSYSTSPAFTVSDGESTTSALLKTCFRQTEYAGVIRGAKNPEGAKAFVDFMQSDEFQSAIPEQMYMYPINDAVSLPSDWKKFAPLSPDPIEVSPTTLADKRDTWIKEWTQVVQG